MVHTHIIVCYSFPSADERFDATFHTNVLVNASGYCQYIPPGILKSTCYIDVRWFPFDVQKCDLKFGSWTHNGWLLDLQMLDVDTSTYIPNGEWDLVGKRDAAFTAGEKTITLFIWYTQIRTVLYTLYACPANEAGPQLALMSKRVSVFTI